MKVVEESEMCYTPRSASPFGEAFEDVRKIRSQLLWSGEYLWFDLKTIGEEIPQIGEFERRNCVK